MSPEVQESPFSGVKLVPLVPHHDRRGWLVEVYREAWLDCGGDVQVNVTWSHANTLRGPHVHWRHSDWFVVPTGSSRVGLKDVRRRSPTFGQVRTLLLDSLRPCALLVPPGVLHGLYFPVDSMLISVESSSYDAAEELSCRWDDPEIGVQWPFHDPLLSDKDRDAPTFAEMMSTLEPWQARL